MKKKNHIWYHVDMDGKLSAHLISEHLQASGVKFEDLFFRAMVHEKEWPIHEVKRGDTVWIVDISPPVEVLKAVREKADFVWIDHHEQVLRALSGYSQDRDIKGIRMGGIAACMLTWAYLNGLSKETLETNTPLAWSEGAPSAVKLVADRDTWSFEYGKLTKLFHAGLQAMDTQPYSRTNIWIKVLTGNATAAMELLTPGVNAWDVLHTIGQDPIATVVKGGVIIDALTAKRQTGTVRGMSYVRQFEGLRCNVVNHPGYGDLGEELQNSCEGADVGICWTFNGSRHTVHMYTNAAHVDVSSIAAKYGGGGHKGAARFSCEKLPF